MRDKIATLTRTWPTVDGVTSEGPWIAGKVAIVLKTPTLTGAADEARAHRRSTKRGALTLFSNCCARVPAASTSTSQV